MPKQTMVARARCKRWSCPYCAAVNRRVWQYRIISEVHERPAAQGWTFFTFTLDGKDHGKGTAHSLRVWRRAWDKLQKRLQREYGRHRYLRVLEAHKDGTLHVHELAACAVPDRVMTIEKDKRVLWTSETVEAHLVALGLGWRHDCRPLRNEIEYSSDAIYIGAYVAKYLTKGRQDAIRAAVEAAGMGKLRVIQASQGWHPGPAAKAPEGEWQVSDGITEAEFRAAEGHRWHDVNLDLEINDLWYWGADWLYPPHPALMGPDLRRALQLPPPAGG